MRISFQKEADRQAATNITGYVTCMNSILKISTMQEEAGVIILADLQIQ